jgi:hypothetical protein
MQYDIVDGTQTVDGPDICEILPGLELTRKTLRQVLLPVPHEFTGLTQMKPPLNIEEKLIEIDDPFELPEQPIGNVHAYEVAPGTGAIEYTTPLWLTHTPDDPEMVPADPGGNPTVPMVALADAKHPFPSITLTV